MKKILILAMMTLLFAVTTLSTTGNFFWVTSTFGTPTSLFGGSGGGNGGPNPNVNPPFPPSSGDPTDWVVFSVGGKIELTGSSVILGLTGTNATTTINGAKPFIFGGNTWIATPTTMLYLGPNADPDEVVNFLSWWEWGSAEQKEIRQLILNGTVKKLQSYKAFAIPDCLKNLSFQEVETKANLLTVTFPNLTTTWDPKKIYYILNSGKIDTASIIVNYTDTNGVKIFVDDHDIVLLIRSLSITGSGELVIERKPGSEKQVFLVVQESLTLSGSGQIRTTDGKDDYVHLFYLGSDDIVFGGSVVFNGSVYVKNSAVTVTGSGKVKAIASTGGTINISGSGITAGTVNTKNSNVFVTGGAFLKEGVSTGGTRVDVSGGPSPFKYIYAPLAKVTLSGSSQINGTIIAGEVLLSGNSPVIGPAYKPIPPECLLVPNPDIVLPPDASGHGLGWYDYESGQIYTTTPYHKISSNPVKIEAKSGKKVKYPNKNDPIMTWQAPKLTFISDLDPTHNQLTLISNVFDFHSDISMKDDGNGKVILKPISGTAFVTFGNVVHGKTTLAISGKSYKFNQTIDLTSSTDRAKMVEVEIY